MTKSTSLFIRMGLTPCNATYTITTFLFFTNQPSFPCLIEKPESWICTTMLVVHLSVRLKRRCSRTSLNWVICCPGLQVEINNPDLVLIVCPNLINQVWSSFNNHFLRGFFHVSHCLSYEYVCAYTLTYEHVAKVLMLRSLSLSNGVEYPYANCRAHQLIGMDGSFPVGEKSSSSECACVCVSLRTIVGIKAQTRSDQTTFGVNWLPLRA